MEKEKMDGIVSKVYEHGKKDGYDLGLQDLKKWCMGHVYADRAVMERELDRLIGVELSRKFREKFDRMEYIKGAKEVGK